MSKNGKAMVADAQFTNEQQHGVSKPQIYTPGSRRTTRSTTSSSTTATRSTRAHTRHVRAPKVYLQQTKSKKKKNQKNNVRDESVYDWRHTTTVPRFVQDDHLSTDESVYDWRHTTTVPTVTIRPRRPPINRRICLRLAAYKYTDSHDSSKTITYHLTNMSTTGGIQLQSRQSRFVHGGRLYAVRI